MTAGQALGTASVEARAGSHAVRLLGAAFLLQAIGSAVSGLVLAPVDLLRNSAPEDMAATMADIAANEWALRASIVGEMVTAGGIVALGVMLFMVLRRHGNSVSVRWNRKISRLDSADSSPVARTVWVPLLRVKAYAVSPTRSA